MIETPVAAEQQVRLIPDAGDRADGVILCSGQVVQHSRLWNAKQLQIALLHGNSQGPGSDLCDPQQRLDSMGTPPQWLLSSHFAPRSMAVTTAAPAYQICFGQQHVERVWKRICGT